MEKIEILKEILNSDNPKSCAAKIMSQLDSEEMKIATYNARIAELEASYSVEVFKKFKRDNKQAYAATDVYAAAAAWRDILGWHPTYDNSSYIPNVLSDGTISVSLLKGVRSFLSFPTEAIAVAFGEHYQKELVTMHKLIDKI